MLTVFDLQSSYRQKNKTIKSMSNRVPSEVKKKPVDFKVMPKRKKSTEFVESNIDQKQMQ